VLVEPWDAIVPPVAKMVTLGRDALIFVWISCRTKSLWRSDLVRSMGEAKDSEAKRPRRNVGSLISNVVEDCGRIFLEGIHCM
jgi:hypothetical protein